MSDIQTYNTQKLIKKILVSILISFGTIIGIFIFTSFRGVTIDFSTFKPLWILAGVASIATAWLADALRLYLTTRAWNKKITYRNSLTGVLSCYFMSSITPSSTGGSPAEMLILNRSGLTWGEAGCLTAICGILFQRRQAGILTTAVNAHRLDRAIAYVGFVQLYILDRTFLTYQLLSMALADGQGVWSLSTMILPL